MWILRFAKDFCGVALWENSHDSDHSRWEKDISQSWRKKDVLHILVHSILLLPHCLLSVRQITLVPPNGHPSFKKMIIKVQGARRAKKLQQNSEKTFLSSYHFLDDDETLHYLDKKSLNDYQLTAFKLILDSLKSESGWSTEKKCFLTF